MTTDRTQPARPAAPNDRSSAGPAERRDGSAFAALLDAHAPAPRREEARHDERAPRPRDAGARQDVRAAEPRDAGARHDDVRDRGGEPRDAGARQGQADDPAARHPQPGDALGGHLPAVPVLPAVPAVSAAEPVAQPSPQVPVAGQPVVGQPVVVPPFVATVPAEAPVTTAPLFMLAPEAVAIAAAPVAPPAAPVEVVTPAAAAPQPAQVVTGTAPNAEPAPQVPAPAPAAAQPAAPHAPEGEQPAEAAAAPAAEAPEPHAAAPARAAVSHEPAAGAAAPAAQSPASEPIGQTPLSAPLSAPVTPERTVPLYRAPAAVFTLLHVAVERGITRAKMALRPAELGGIEIRLQATAGGVAAQVVADSPEAARLLAQAGDDLRRALEARAVTLISLEVSTSSEQRQHDSARGQWGDTTPTVSGRAAGVAEGDAEPVPTTQTVIELPGGLLVDVLA